MREKISQNAVKSVFVCYLCIKYLSYTIMLINFSFGNFRSFRDIKSLRMEAGRVDDLTESVIEKEGFRLLPVAAIYGANSSGKTNVIDALGWFRYIVTKNSKLDPGDILFQDPFLLDVQTQEAPTVFEIQILLEGVVYRYGFEYLSTEVVSEWLYEKEVKPYAKERRLFQREKQEIDISLEYFPEGKNKKELTTKNRLFLSLVAQLNGNISQKLIKYLSRCNTISGLKSDSYERLSLKMIEHQSEGYQEAMELFKKLDLGFTAIEVEEKELPGGLIEKLAALPNFDLKELQEQRIYQTYTTHNVYNKKGKIVKQTKFRANHNESNGTNKVISFSGPLFNTLLKGKVLFVDELDAQLHPILTRAIVRLFMDKETNPKGAQLVFTTHDTHLLDKECLRRDQVWFTEKDAAEASDLYSLLEFKERNDRNFEKNYIQGRYGAIPFIR